MAENLKSLKAERYPLQLIIQNTKSNEEVFNRYSDQKEYSHWLEYLHTINCALQKEIDSLPIGYKFIGVFYIIRPYSNPQEIIKIVGTAFMREDLVSWAIESDTVDVSNYGYFRNVYKDDNCQTILKREDAAPLFAELDCHNKGVLS